MTPCPTSDTLKQVVAGALPEKAAVSVRAHINSCPQCQATLDRLSDDADLPVWVRETARQMPEACNEPRLQRLLQDMRAAGDTSVDGVEAATDSHLSLLAPPQCEGDLGSLGPYRVLVELGRGGMGIVFRGYDESLQRPVAIKILRPELASANTRARLVREAQAAARFKHDHVVSVYAVADPPGGLPFLVMEYLAGPTLSEMIRARKRLDPGAAAAVAVQVADGLAAAHAANLVHRDVKPSNIIFDPQTDRAKILDFGLVRTGEGATDLTREGSLAGTPNYMSPEQAAGSSAIDARTDVYSLGVTLYEMLTGEAPFRGTLAMVIQQVLDEEPRPPRLLNDAIPLDLETVCLKAMAKEPSRRYQTSKEFSDDLRRWQRGEPIHARPVGAVERGWRWCRRNPRVAVLSVAVLALLLLFAGGSTTAAILIFQAKTAADKSADQARIAKKDADQSADDARTAQKESAANAKAAGTNFTLALNTLRLLIEKVQKQLGAKPGTLALRQQILEDALKQLEAIAKSAETAPQVDHNLIVAHDTLGDLFYTLGDSPKAREQFELARSRAAALVQANPDDVTAHRDLAKAHDKIGDQLRYGLDYKGAAESYQKAFDLREAMVKAGMKHDMVRRERSVSRNKLGDISLAAKDPAKALEYFKEGLQFLQTDDLSEKERELLPGDLRFSYGRLGDASFNMGDLRAADGYFRQSLFYAEALAKEGNPTARIQMAVTYQRLGKVCQRLKEADIAEDWYRKSLALHKEDADADPGNAELLQGVVSDLSLVADAQHWGGKLDLARETYLQTLAACEELAQRDPSSAQKQLNVRMTCLRLVTVAARQENFAESAEWTEKIVALYRRDEDHMPPAFRLERQYYEIWLEAAKLAAEGMLDDPSSIEKQKPPVATWLLRLRAVHLARRGQYEEAAPIAERLRKLKPPNGFNNFYAACCYSHCIEALSQRPKPPTREEQALEQEYLERAVACIHETVPLGPDWADTLLTDPFMDCVCRTLGYAQFVEEIHRAVSGSK